YVSGRDSRPSTDDRRPTMQGGDYDRSPAPRDPDRGDYRSRSDRDGEGRSRGALRPIEDTRPLAPPPRTVLVRKLTCSGGRLLDHLELAKGTGKVQGRPLAFGQIRTMAHEIQELYHARGYFLARVVVPEQELRDGEVQIQVVEGHFGRLSIEG